MHYFEIVIEYHCFAFHAEQRAFYWAGMSKGSQGRGRVHVGKQDSAGRIRSRVRQTATLFAVGIAAAGASEMLAKSNVEALVWWGVHICICKANSLCINDPRLNAAKIEIVCSRGRLNFSEKALCASFVTA